MESRHLLINSLVMLLVAFSLTVNPATAAHKDKHKQKPLPPGLQKKIDRGGSLPPGWENKLVRGEILEAPIFDQSEVVIPVDSSGNITVRLDDKLVKVIEATREVIDIVEILNSQ